MTTEPGGVGPALDGSGRPYDQITLVGITATGFHGVFEHERREGQLFRADVVVYLDTRRAAATDDLALTVDYGTLATEVAAVLAGEPADLIETVAERIAATALAHPAVAVVDVSLHKPQAPVTVPFDDILVTIRRDHHKLPAAEPWSEPAGEALAGSAPGSASSGSSFDDVQQPAPILLEVTSSGSPADEATGSIPGQDEPRDEPRVVSGSLAEVGSAALAVEAFAAAVAAAVPVGHPAEAFVGHLAPVVAVADPVAEAEVEAPEARAADRAEPALAEQTLVQPAVVTPPAADLAYGDASPADPDRLEQDRAEQDRAEQDRLEQAPAEPVEIVLALGSNLGAQQDTLRAAIASLADVDGLEIVTVSPLARTAAVGGPEQPDYLNAVLIARTTLSPRALLRATQQVEDAHGRQRNEHWGPRTLDVDVIVYGSTLAVTDDLELPHPRAHERAFVLQPWVQIAPDAVLPGLGGGPVAALAATAPDRGGIRWLALDWLTAPHSSPTPRPAAPAGPEPSDPRLVDPELLDPEPDDDLPTGPDRAVAEPVDAGLAPADDAPADDAAPERTAAERTAAERATAERAAFVRAAAERAAAARATAERAGAQAVPSTAPVPATAPPVTSLRTGSLPVLTDPPLPAAPIRPVSVERPHWVPEPAPGERES